MKELEYLNTIKTITKSNYIGDDCAYLKEFDIVLTQDNLVEDVHFKRQWCTPFQLGYKAAIVNISDVLASGAKPQYLSIGLSLPKNVESNFVEEFYKGVQKGAYGAEIIGGDLTGGDKIFISITAIGNTKDRNISSRSYARNGYYVITHGEYGSSAQGLELLQNGCFDKQNKFIKAHLEPELNENFSEKLALQEGYKYAMMDTSDGLADALFKIADASGVTLEIDYEKIHHDISMKDKNKILFGGEDYHLVAVVPEKMLENLNDYYVIGKVVEKTKDVKLIIDERTYSNYDELCVYNHF